MPKQPRVRTCSSFDEGEPVASQRIDDRQTIEVVMKAQILPEGFTKYLHKCTEKCEPNKHWCSFGISNATKLKCDHSTQQSTNLTTHEIRMHTNVVYPCEVYGCSFEWADPAALHKHMRKRHGYVPKPRPKRDSSTFARGDKLLQRPNQRSQHGRKRARSASTESSSLPDFVVPSFPQPTPPATDDFPRFPYGVPPFPPYYDDSIGSSAVFGLSPQAQQPPAISAGPAYYSNSISGVPLDISSMMTQSQQTEQFLYSGDSSGTLVSNMANMSSGTWTNYPAPSTTASGYSLGHSYYDQYAIPPSHRVGDGYPVQRRPCSEERDDNLPATAFVDTFDFSTGNTLGCDFGVLPPTSCSSNVYPHDISEMEYLTQLMAEADRLIYSRLPTRRASYYRPY